MTPTNTRANTCAPRKTNPGTITAVPEQSQSEHPKRSRVHWLDLHLGTTGYGGLHTDQEAHDVANRLDALSSDVKHWVEKDMEVVAE